MKPKNKNFIAIYFILIFETLVVSCATPEPNQYYWGDYENTLYKSAKHKKGADPTEQIQELTQLINKAQASGKQVPPGVFAHLGYMQSIEGDNASALQSFQKEKLLFPASKVFIDRLIKSLTSKKSEKIGE